MAIIALVTIMKGRETTYETFQFKIQNFLTYRNWSKKHETFVFIIAYDKSIFIFYLNWPDNNNRFT